MIKPYDHVVVDEAQDLHPAQWRMLRAATAEGPNDLFIAGDVHQRIYDNRVTLGSLGINVRGRSHRLRLNYRTTHEIMTWSLGLLSGEHFEELDGGAARLTGYQSEMHGPTPTRVGFTTRESEMTELTTAVRTWIDGGVEPHAVAVTARTKAALDAAWEALGRAGVKVQRLEGKPPTAGKVVLGTMHRMKGLEFRCVAVVDARDGVLPMPVAVRPETEDPVGHRQDLQRGRCLLYVACTRARDDLRVSWSGQPSPFLSR